MKGRRRARRAALQALYELDQSTHDLEAVLEARLEDLYRSAIDSSVEERDREVARELVGRHRATGFVDAAPDEVAAYLGVPAERVEAVLALLAGLRPQAAYAAELVRGVARHRPALDAVIRHIAPEWPVDQMAPVDRNILRIALWEISRGLTPLRVAINEAVELARLFSGEGARRMVNGALGAFATDGRPVDLSGGAP